MSRNSLLVGALAGFFLSFPILGSTIVTGMSSCQAFQFGSSTPLFTQSQSVAFTTNDVSGTVNGLNCATPFGTMTISFDFESKIDPIFGTVVNLSGFEGADSIGAPFGLTAFAAVHVSAQQTLIPSGGTGVGFMVGTGRGSSDPYTDVGFSGFGSFSITTPFGGCPPTCFEPLSAPYSVPFVFGEPLTIDQESDLAFGITLSEFGLASAGGLFTIGPPPFQPVVDANGNPILGVVFTPVPEPGSAFLAGGALLLGAALMARLRR